MRKSTTDSKYGRLYWDLGPTNKETNEQDNDQTYLSSDVAMKSQLSYITFVCGCHKAGNLA